MIEEWKEIEGYKGRYKIFNTGKVYSIQRDIILKSHITSSGHGEVHIVVDNKQLLKTIHVLVANAFILQHKSREYRIVHLDGNKLNNHSSNLELTKNAPNKSKSVRRLKVDEVAQIRKELASGLSVKAIAESYGCGLSAIYDIANGRSYNDANRIPVKETDIEIVLEIKKLYSEGKVGREIAELYNMKLSTVY